MESDGSKHTDHALAQSIQKILSTADEGYLSNHTNIPKLLNEYLISLAETRPTDVDAFTKAFFASFKVDKSDLVTTPLVIIGPSGCGKETLHKRLRRQYPYHFAFSVSYTTRSPRPGEVEGVNYFYINPDQFQARIDSGDFLEHVTFSGNQYGTSKSYLEKLAKQGRICIIEVDIQGAKKLREAGFKANNVFIKPPAIEELRTRLTKRGTETQEVIERRIKIAEQELAELEKSDFIDHVLVNDNFETFYHEAVAYLKKHYNQFVY